MARSSRSNLKKWITFEIWAASDRTEAGIFAPVNCNKEQYYLLTHTVDDEPMMMLKRFKAPSWEEAKKVYKKVMGF